MILIDRPSPNHDSRRGAPIDILLLHYTGMPSTNGALGRLCEPAAKVSAHYLIDEDGAIYRMVPEDRRAWHAGVSFWAGARDVNARSVGIELANPGHEGGLPSFPEAQMAALEQLAGDVLARHPIPPSRVLGHSDVAPERKQDPGERFDWRRLARAGIGLWPEECTFGPEPALAAGDGGPEVLWLQGALASFGYRSEATGIYDAQTVCIVTAFQRHYRPDRIDGVADGETRIRLRTLVENACRIESA